MTPSSRVIEGGLGPDAAAVHEAGLAPDDLNRLDGLIPLNRLREALPGGRGMGVGPLTTTVAEPITGPQFPS